MVEHMAGVKTKYSNTERTKYKYFAFGDAHGHYTVLRGALAAAGFDSDNPSHVLINLGDSFDRGVENLRILNWYKEMFNKGRLHNIMGNHDEFIYDLLGEGDAHKIGAIFNMTHNGLDKTAAEMLGNVKIYGSKFSKQAFDAYRVGAQQFKWLLDDSVDEIVIGDRSFTHAGKVLAGDAPGYWRAFNWADSRKFITNYPNPQNQVNVFGHFAATQLYEAIGEKNSPYQRPFISQDEKFYGLDVATNYTKQMAIYVYESDDVVLKIKYDSEY